MGQSVAHLIRFAACVLWIMGTSDAHLIRFAACVL